MIVSVLMPSRENAEGFERAAANLAMMSNNLKAFEVVLMVDYDDPQYTAYQEKSLSLGRCFSITAFGNDTIKGYGNLHRMYEECAKAARVLVV